jgi:hypothetical protein
MKILLASPCKILFWERDIQPNKIEFEKNHTLSQLLELVQIFNNMAVTWATNY